MLKKIVIIGPESTGKSTLCQQLAAHYKTLWVPEYARNYLNENGKDYRYNDLLEIAKGQLTLEDEYVEKFQISDKSEIRNQKSEILFIDTDLYVMKVWSEFVFDKCDDWILEQIVQRNYDLYLLCNIDLPWVKDDLREYPEVKTREKLYNIYRDILINQSVPWVDIKGSYEQRLLAAINAVDAFAG